MSNEEKILSLLTSIQYDILSFKQDIVSLKQDMLSIKQDISEIKAVQKENMNSLNDLRRSLDQTNKEFLFEEKKAVSDIPPMKEMIMEHEFLFRKMRVK